MSANPLSPTAARALFSADRKTWSDGQVLDWSPDSAVTKIVIGEPARREVEADEGTAISLAAALPDDLAERFPNLSHLYLWQIRDLTELPALPAGLQCLDVRGCRQLISLPELPARLESLDVGQCGDLRRLPEASAALKRFYCNDCNSLKTRHLENFLAGLAERNAPLQEMDGSGCDAVRSLDEFPRTLQKLVLAGCQHLCDVGVIPEFTGLRHMNLSGCTQLTSLPDIPPDLRYLELQGSQALRRFLGQDIGPYDRGTTAGENVVKRFYSRRKFGAELAASAHAKLLLMGDGRVGKTTLAKRLQWDTLTAAQQKDPDFAHLKPSDAEPFSHKVHFWRWDTVLRLPEDEASSLNERARTAGLASPCDAQDGVPGAVRLWDFGGQEIYHQTHRLFAAEGSIFLLVWRSEAWDDEALQQQMPSGCDNTEWQAWNRQRSLDYWLDYIDSVRANAHIALVCTFCPQGSVRVAWQDRALRHAERELPCFYIDSLDDNECQRNPDYQSLLTWVRTRCGREAARIGILQPAFYSQVADFVDAMLAENEQARHREQASPHLLMAWQDWQEQLIDRHASIGASRKPLDTDDVATITGYLHDAGQIFHLRQRRDSAVLVDQEWATGLIYEMFRPGGKLSRKIKFNGGWFYPDDLAEDDHWKRLETDLERDQMLTYMEECGVIVRLSAREENRVERDIYLAIEKWLLPEYAEVEQRIDDQMKRIRESPKMSARDKFAFDERTVSEFDFRALLKHLGGFFGTRAIWFRNGLQASPADADPDWCFRLRWVASKEDAFLGTVDAVLIAREQHMERLAQDVEEIFAAEGSPMARLPKPRRKVAAEEDLLHGYFRAPRDSDYDIAVSSSGADKAAVAELLVALKASGLRPYWYRDPACRSDEYAKVMKFMHGLRTPPCVLLYLSDGYLNDDPVTNWYCPWELADAITRIQEGKRTAAQTMIVYAKGGQLSSQNLLDVIVALFSRMAEHFGNAYAAKPVHDRPNFKYYDELSAHFLKPVHSQACKRFFEERGTLGTYSIITEHTDGTKDFSGIIDDIRKALRA